MQLEVEITGKTTSDDYGYNRVEFSVFNDEDVSFLDSVSLAQACYLIEHDELKPGPYRDLMSYINSNEFESIEIGKKFTLE